MAIQTVNGGLYYPDPYWSATDFRPSEGTLAIDAANEKVAMIFQAPKTGNIDQVSFRVVAHTSAATLVIRLETVAADGTPSGTLVGTNTSGTQLTTGANTTHTVTLTAAAAVTKGTHYALVVAQPAASAGNCTIQFWSNGSVGTDRNNQRHRLCYCLQFTASWESKTTTTAAIRAPSMAVRYDDTSWYWIPGAFPVSAFNRTTFNSGSTPDERGTRIITPFAARVTGFFFQGSCTAQDYSVVLYDSGGTALLTFSGDKDIFVGYGGTNYAGLHVGYFSSTVDLAAGDTVYLLLKPASTTNVLLPDFDILDTGTAAMMGIFNGGTDLIFAQRTDAGSITTTDTKRPLSMGLIFSGFDDAAGGSGSVTSHIANMNRGLS